MKRTKNMIYKPTVESHELFLYTINDGFLYKHHTMPIINNLVKKAKKGLYDCNKAVDLYYNLATAGSDKYNKDFGYKFSVQDRFTCAVELEEYYREDHVFYECNNN